MFPDPRVRRDKAEGLQPGDQRTGLFRAAGKDECECARFEYAPVGGVCDLSCKHLERAGPEGLSCHVIRLPGGELAGEQAGVGEFVARPTVSPGILEHRLTQLGDELPAAQRPQLDAAIALCSDTLTDTRELSRLLRPPILDDFGLEAALRWLARSVGETAALDVELQVEPLPPLNGDVETLLFRVAQEALNNTAKHARARNVLLRLVARGGTLQLQLVDDGNGCDPELALRSGGSGLGGMRERLRLYDGHLELHSAPGEGTRLRAVVPLATTQ